jgi:zinc protease
MIRFVSRLTFAGLVMLAALPARAEIAIQEVTSPGGITAWLVEEHSIPFTALEIRFRGGTSLDPEGREGATYLMTGLLEEGAADRDAQAFAAAREDLAATFEFDASQDAVSVSSRFLTENRDEAVALLRDALVTPRFDQDAVDRVRDQVLSGIRSDAQDPGAIGNAAFDAMAFPGHPYARQREGTVDSATALTRDDVVAAHLRAIARDRIYVAAVGDITPDALGVLLDRLLGDLPATGAPLPPSADYAATGGVTVVPFDTPQSVVLFGHEGIARDDPDFFAAFVANEILGGRGFGSRLMTEVREKRGLTYGIGTYLGPMDAAALVMGQAATSNASAGEAVQVIRDEWARIASGDVTEAELADSKTYLTGSYPLRFDGNDTIARILVGMQMDDLPIDYAVTRNAEIEALTLDDIDRVARRIYRPDDLRFVVVGTPDGLENSGDVGN